MKKYIVEFIGTFFLVLTIGMAVRYAGVMAPLAIGAVLMVMIYAGGHVSGGHYNPAVTLGVLIRGKIDMNDAIPYRVSQILGSIVAGLVVSFMGASSSAMPISSDMMIPALLAEVIFTFALVYVVLNVATTKGTSGNSFYGLAIGCTVLAGAYAVGSISWGAFNPAVAIGGVLDGTFAASTIWIHIVGDVIGAILAALVFNYCCSDDQGK